MTKIKPLGKIPQNGFEWDFFGGDNLTSKSYLGLYSLVYISFIAVSLIPSDPSLTSLMLYGNHHVHRM